MNRNRHSYSITVLYGFCILLLFNFSILKAAQSDTGEPSAEQQSAFSAGELLFKTNRPSQAAELLEKSLSDAQTPPAVYNYLGTAYMQTGNIRKALEVFLRGVEVPGTDKKSLYYNAGNAAFLLGDYAQAQDYFSLSLAADASWAPSFLNRGNTRVRLGKYSEAIADYSDYIALTPGSSQEAEIKRMIGALNEELAFREKEQLRRSEEAERIRLEQERLQAERERIAAEKARLEAEKAAADAERRRKILEEVSASLQKDTSQSLSAGTEGVLDYEYEEIELE